jgi:hypothetical protein
MLLSFTLDTNCLIAVADRRPEAEPVIKLAEAHAAQAASVALVAISASERQKDGRSLSSFSDFKTRTSELGLGHLEVLKPIAYFDLTFFDWCVFSDEAIRAEEQSIHSILFPNIPFFWKDYCASLGLDENQPGLHQRWRNAKCDVLAFWSHLKNRRDIFVTSDQNFHKQTKKSALLTMGGGRIEFPRDAANLLPNAAGAA